VSKPSRNGKGKRFTESARIERLGVALCQSVVTRMGHIWREKGVDYGIDGEIELVDDGQVLNRVLWVQSKAKGGDGKFPGETEGGFRYMCSQVDIDYWLSGTAPVLLVCSRPDAGEAWFKHLPSWFGDASRRRERSVEFHKVADRFDASASRRLLTLGVEASSGVYLSPPPRKETLTTNLLTVEHLAPRAYVAPTRCRGWSDSNPRLVKAGHDLVSDVVFHDGKIYSFRRLDEPPLDVLTDGAMDSIGTDELADSPDDRDQQLLRWLLSATLKELTSRELRLHSKGGYLYFKAPADGSTKRVFVAKGRGRAVVQRYDPPEGATWKGYTRHYALEFQFVQADSDWHLALVPTYHYTSDGREDFPYSASQIATMKRIEGHEAVRGQTSFWGRYLSWTPTLFSGDPDPRLRFGRLATVEVDRGIDDRSWKPAPDVEMVPPDDDAASDEDLTLFDLNWAEV
jgi:hypothetical protein